MTLDEQKRAVLALFDEAASWGVPALDARHLPRIAGALGIGMPEPVRVPPAQVIVPDPMHEGAGVLRAEPVRVPLVQELEVRCTPLHECTGVLHAVEEEVETRETKYGRLPVCRFMADLTGEQMNRVAANFCRRHNVERCALSLPAGVNIHSMSAANCEHRQGYFISEMHKVFGLRQAKHYPSRRPFLKLKGERHA
jgi:hypothetical protein